MVAQPRVYRDGMQCRSCGSTLRQAQEAAQVWALPREADLSLRQCLRHFIPETKHPLQPELVKSLAVSMYAEGSGIEAISRVLGMKAGTFYSRVEKSQPDPESVADGGGATPGSQPGTGVAHGHIL